jgi:hypothetical protein
MSIDVGMFLQERRDLQNAADAAALAAAQELPFSPADAVSDATSWAEKNGIGAGELEGVTVSTTYADDDTVTVAVKRDVPWLFARVLGRGSDTISADASARVGSPEWADNVMPWALKESIHLDVTYGEEVTLKYSAGDKETGGQCNNAVDDDADTKVNDGCNADGAPESGAQCDNSTDDDGDNKVNDGCPAGTTSGNYGMLDLGGGSGCDSYRENIVSGADVTVHSLVPTEPGNCVGPTEQGLKDRLNACSAECESFEQVFVEADEEGCEGFDFTSNRCNPWEDEGQGSTRVVLVPVISDADAGKSEVEVLRFALVFLTNAATDNICKTGNECDVKAIFVKACEDFGSILGEYDPNSDIRFARLVE